MKDKVIKLLLRALAWGILALLAGVETAFLGGPVALAALAPLWVAALGAAITWAYNRLTY